MKMSNENDLMAEMPPPRTLLDVEEVEAVCFSVELVEFRAKNPKWEFTFQVLQPDKYFGVELRCYANKRLAHWKKGNPSWASYSSKLNQMATIAARGERVKRIAPKLFVGKRFRCKVRASGQGSLRYSIIDDILERLD